MSKDKKCCAGCKRYDGHETIHLKDCPFYPESIQKIRDDADRNAVKEIKAVRKYIKDKFAQILRIYPGELQKNYDLLSDLRSLVQKSQGYLTTIEDSLKAQYLKNKEDKT